MFSPGVSTARCVFVLLVFGAGTLGVRSLGLANERPPNRGKAAAEAFWTSVRRHPIRYSDIPRDKKGATQFWAKTSVDMPSVLEDLWPNVRQLNRAAQRQAVNHYIEQFGKHGSDADFRWFLVGLTFLYPDGNDRSETPRDLYKFCLMIDEALTRRMLECASIRDRFVYLTAWLNFFLDQEKHKYQLFQLAVAELSDGGGFPKEGDMRGPDYWSDALWFMIMAHVTGRDDVFENADPERLHSRFRRWRKWWVEN